MLFRHPKATASALIMCCLLLAAWGDARGQDAAEPADPTAASEGSNAAHHSASAPDTSPRATEVASPPKPAETPKPHFKVQLLLVRTDWSQGKDVADLDGTLKEVLKDIALPESLRANLAKAAPAALFPNQFPVTYEPGEFAAALAWMRAHELVRVEEIELLPVHEDYLTGRDGYQRFFVSDKLMPVPGDGRGNVPPYVTQEKGWEWCLHFTSHDREESDENAIRRIDVDIQRSVQKREQRSVRGQAAVSSVDTTYESKPIRVTFPADQILAMSGYTPDTAAQNDWWNSFTSRQEWEPIVTLSPANLQAPEVEEPRLTSPTSIVEVSHPQDFRFPARLDQGFKREDTSSVEITDENTARVTVQLIRARSDWSKGKDPEETKKALESLLEGASLPDGFRKDLLGSASRILFPEDFAAIYQPGQFADLLAWMTERELVHVDARSEPLPDDNTKTPEACECKLFVSHDVVPLPINPSVESVPPFVTRTYGWEWTCSSWLEPDEPGGQPNLQISLFRTGLRLDEIGVDGEKSVTREPLSGDVKSVALPADRIAVIRHFDSRDAMSQRTRQTGWEPLLVVRPVALAEPQASDHPQPRKPSALVKLSNRSRRRETSVPQRVPSASIEALALGSSHEPNQAPAAEADQQGSQVIVFQLKHADLTQVIRALAAVTSDVRAQVGNQGRSLTVMGPKDDLAVARDLIEALDQPAAPDQRQIKIFHLVHARAEQMAAILQQLFPEITMSGDERTNSLIAQGEQRRLEAAEAVIQRLDETPSEKQEPALDEASRRRIVETASSDFASAEAEIQSIVESIAGEADQKKAEQLRARLTGLVGETFDLRQKLQRAEVALLKERVGIIETRLGQRETLRKEIIERRVEELLAEETSPAEPTGAALDAGRPGAASSKALQMHFRYAPMGDVLRWLAEARGMELRILDKLPEKLTFNYRSEEPVTPNEAQEILQSVLVTKGYRLFETEADGKRLLCLQATATAQTPVTALSTQVQPTHHAGQLAGVQTASSWVSDDVVRLLNPKDREAAWKVAYEQQRLKNPWDSSLSPRFHECVKTIGQDGKIPNNFLIEYQKFAANYVPFLKRIVSSVTWNDSAYASIQRTFYWATRPLSVEVWTAQEDIWAYQAILRSIAEVNERAASEGRELPIQRIEALEIGQPAGTAMNSIRPRRARLAYFGDAQGLPDGTAAEAAPKPTPPAATPAGTSPPHTRTEEEVAKTLRTGRYVDLSGAPLPADMQRYPEFNLLPVRLVVDIDQSRLPDLLAQLAACSTPGDVGYVELNSDPSAQDESGPGQQKRRVRAEILGVIRIFNPPDKAKLSGVPEGSVLQGAASQVPEQASGMLVGPRPTLPLRTPEEFQRAASDARVSIERLQSRMHTKDEYDGIERDLASAQQRLTLIQAEFATQLRLLESEVRKTELECDVAQSQWRTVDDAVRKVPNSFSRNEVNKYRATSEVAKAQLEQAKALLELYLKAGENPDLNPGFGGDSNESSAAVERPQTRVLTGTTLPLRSPEEFALAAREAVVELRQASTMRVRERRENEDPAEYEEFVASERRDALAWTQQRLNLVREEFVAQVHLLELEVRTMEAAAATAHEELQRLTKLHESGAAPASEVSGARLKAEQTSMRQEQARTLLELYLKAGENADLNPGSAEPPKKPAENKGTATEAVSPMLPITSGAPSGSPRRLPLRSPEEFQRLAAEARKQVEDSQHAVDTAPTSLQGMDRERYQQHLQWWNRDLESAKQRLALIQAEYAAQLQMLTTELAAAEVAVKSTAEAVDLAKERYVSGVVPHTELNKAELEYQQAKAQLDQLNILFRLYKNLADNPDLGSSQRQEVEAGNAGATSPAPGNAGKPLQTKDQ